MEQYNSVQHPTTPTNVMVLTSPHDYISTHPIYIVPQVPCMPLAFHALLHQILLFKFLPDIGIYMRNPHSIMEMVDIQLAFQKCYGQYQCSPLKHLNIRAFNEQTRLIFKWVEHKCFDVVIKSSQNCTHPYVF